MAPSPSPSPSPSPDEMLKFQLWSSSVKEDFWHRLTALKLDALQLDDKPLEIQGFFAPSLHDHYMQLRYESFISHPKSEEESVADHRNSRQCSLPGTLYNYNTKEEFFAPDKRALLSKEAEKIWKDICSGQAFQDSTLLNRFFLISYADLKKWQFHYWFAFPALKFESPATCSGFQPALQILNAKEAAGVLVACETWRRSSQLREKPFFLLHLRDELVVARPISDWVECQRGGKVIVGFYDPSQDSSFPGWPLRNLLILAAVHWRTTLVQVLCYREKKGQIDLELCLIGDVKIPEYTAPESQAWTPDAAGWEYDLQPKVPRKLGPRMIDLSSSMDPSRLAQSAADLNLKLMKWRLLPSLDITLLSNAKCLLLGAGTLGCQVARGLLAWGVRHITLVDCGNVAMSNPVRQSLYEFSDCLNGGKSKAEAAADCLKRILPGVEVTGIRLTIPMPGHSVSKSEVTGVMNSCTELHSLVDEHDVIFLLTDTRESRWLPTVLCASLDKVAINAALGFDTFLVMRHGAGLSSLQLNQFSEGLSADLDKTRLGCYFCNDVVAPEDSTVNRTLDQQCTVTRPGVAQIAAALAVELAVNLLHHSSGTSAPAGNGVSTNEEALGALPHQIRGFTASFSQLLITGTAFSRCTACSPHVVAEYRKNGFDFLMSVFNNPTYLEDLTGLTELINATEGIEIDWDD